LKGVVVVGGENPKPNDEKEFFLMALRDDMVVKVLVGDPMPEWRIEALKKIIKKAALRKLKEVEAAAAG
jgi:hypothetical protein